MYFLLPITFLFVSLFNCFASSTLFWRCECAGVRMRVAFCPPFFAGSLRLMPQTAPHPVWHCFPFVLPLVALVSLSKTVWAALGQSRTAPAITILRGKKIIQSCSGAVLSSAKTNQRTMWHYRCAAWERQIEEAHRCLMQGVFPCTLWLECCPTVLNALHLSDVHRSIFVKLLPFP